MPFSFLIIAAGLSGVVLAAYIHHTKRVAKPLVCPLRANCNVVIRSEYSYFLGVPVEVLGVMYYSLITLSYVVISVAPGLAIPEIRFVLLLLSTVAFLFSLYLIFIQSFYLRQWCSWCLLSAILCILIFGMTVTSSYQVVVPLLAAYRLFLLGLHLFAMAIGLGGATVADFLFFRFLKDFRISYDEAAILRSLSQVIWVGLALLVMTGVGLYLPQAEALNASGKFLAKMVVVSVIIINGAFLNLYITPRLVNMCFGRQHPHHKGELHSARRIALALGAISATSWYSAFILGVMPRGIADFTLLISGYFGIVAGAVVVSQLIDRAYFRYYHHYGR
jgi:uncharacterized membrane protein